MYLRSLLLSASLLCLIHGGRAEPKFSMSVPAKITSGEEATICIVIIDLEEELSFDIFIDVGSENITIFSTEIPAGNFDECKTFQTPQLKSAAPVFVTLDATGSNTKFKDRRSVVIDIPQTITLIQMDKYIYKPGDTVRCRLISVTEDLRWKEESFKEAYVKGPTGSRMYQWLNNNEHFNKFRGLENFEFRLPTDTMTGSHTIEIVKESGALVNEPFTVEPFTLPRFSMEVNAPKAISMMDKSMTYSVFAKYTYGLGVPGKLSGRLCRQYYTYYGTTCNRNPDGICTPITEELGSDGQFNGTMDLSLFQMDGSGLEQNLKLQITLIEEGTGIQLTDTQFIQITSQTARVFFLRYDDRYFYKPGIPFAGKAQLVDGVQKPLFNEILELQVNGLTVQNLTTNEAGIAEFEIDTTGFALAQVSLQINYRNPGQCSENNWVVPVFVSDYYTINRFYSRSRSYIQLWGPTEELSCGQTFSIRVQYALSASGLKDGQFKNNFYYMVMSKSKIIQSGKHEVDLSATLNGEFSISLTASVDFAYIAKVIVYSMLQEETIVDTVQLKIEKCLRDEISVSFSPNRGTPGSNVDLSLTAFSRGMCAVSIIDSSLALLSQYKRLRPDMIYNNMRNVDLRGYYVAGFNVEEAPPPCKNNIGDLFYNGSYYQEVSYPGEGDSYQTLRDVGVVFLTNTNLRKPEMCNSGYNPYNPYNPYYTPYYGTTLLMNERRFNGGNPEINLAPIETIRKIFPDVWKFYFVQINEDSSGSDTLVVPDTITNWQADVYCMGPTSQFGMTEYPVNFTSFQLFFVTMNLPNLVIRNEIMELKVFVSNYMEYDIKIHVTLAESDKFTAELEEGEQDMCVPAGKRGSYAWKLKPISQGILDISVTAETTHIGTTCDGPSDPNQPQRKDTVIQPVIVEVEGIQKELTRSELVCVDDDSIVIPASIALQPNAVDGSSRVSITVTGDILSFAVDNPGALIWKPKGCGEQTLAIILHLPSLLLYLESTNQLNDKIIQSAKAAMLEGYINMLKFQNYDGGFSAFSGTYQTSSTWLTALTYRALYQIKKYIFVDDSVTTRALMFLESSQDLVTGGFSVRGTLFNNNLKGGADNDISLTSYIVYTLLQSSYIGRQTLLRGALDYLVASASRDDLSLYNMAMLYCALSEAKLDAGETVFAKLMEKAVSEDGKLYWEQLEKPKSNSNSFFYAPSSSANIELTGYVLMCMAKKPSPSQSDINTMTRIVLWLMEQRNSLGGFQSTTDSAVVLEAFAYYGMLTFEENASNQVKVTKGSEVVAEFSVDQNERLLVQRKPLPTVPGDYSITVSGKGCALVQTTMQFNVPVPDEDSAFSLTANTPSESCVNGVAYTFPVNVSLRYNGDRNQTNMVLVKTKPPSGYMLSYQSQMQLKTQFPKVEEKDQMFYIYIDAISSKTVSMQFEFEMTSRVLNLQPTFVQAEDYYELDDVGSTVLYHPCNIP